MTAERLGCVLAGGKSSRMGRDKATLSFRGRPLVEHAVARLRAIGCQVAIAGSRPDLESYAPVLPDLHPGCGPLGGIESALAAALAEDGPGIRVLFVPVDLPLLPATFLSLLLERAERTGAPATIPLLGGRPQPLCAVYSVSLLDGISAALGEGDHKVMRILESVTRQSDRDFFSVEAALNARGDLLDSQHEPLHRWFANINTPEELSALSPHRSGPAAPSNAPSS